MRRVTFTPVPKKHAKRRGGETIEAKVMRARLQKIVVAQRRVKRALDKMSPEQREREFTSDALDKIKQFLAQKPADFLHTTEVE